MNKLERNKVIEECINALPKEKMARMSGGYEYDNNNQPILGTLKFDLSGFHDQVGRQQAIREAKDNLLKLL